MAELKSGALSRAEIQAVWEGSVDKGYRDPLVRAGEGKGFEAWTQLFAQFERASKAVDVTTQAMFISPWSGQTNDPASGGQKATVTLKVSRSKRLHEPLYLQAGLFVVEEETTDFGPGAGVVVRTGRRYLLANDLYFAPGEQGPMEAVFEAERFGYGYNNPLPGTIKAIEQKGSLFENDRATVEVTSAPADLAGVLSKTRVVTWNEPDMFVPDHLGQYVVFTNGANAGQVGRMTSFDAPIPPSIGSAMEITRLFCFAINPFTYFGTFNVGDILTITNGPTVTYGKIIDIRMVAGAERVAFTLLNGPVANILPGSVISSATGNGNIDTIDFAPNFVAEAPVVGIGGATWRILDWIIDWGLEAVNELSPQNGKAAFLDELGFERAIGRSPGEGDESYRERVREIADVVTPNAIRRALNRAMPGIPWNFREVGLPLLPGFFYDGTNEEPDVLPHGGQNDAYDVDTIELTGILTGTFEFQEPVILEDPSNWAMYVEGWMGRLSNFDTTMTVIRKTGWPPPSGSYSIRVRGLRSGATFDVTAAQTNDQGYLRRYRVWLNYLEFRGFFLVTIPPLAFGEFGFPYDTPTYQNNGYDIPDPWMTAYDGFPRLASDTYRRVWDAVEAARAGGVGWELRLEDKATGAATYTYAYVPPPAPAPIVASLRDVIGDTGGGGRTQYVNGSNFQSGATVTFGGVAATNVVFIDPMQIQCTIPAHAAGLTDVVVTNPDAQDSGTSGQNLFRYWNPTLMSTATPDGYLDSRKQVTDAGGGAVSSWIDQVSGSRDYQQATAGNRPTLVADDFHVGVSSIRFAQTPSIRYLEESKRVLANGLCYFWVTKWTSADTTGGGVLNLPLPVTADSGGTVYNAAGATGGQLRYVQFDEGWTQTDRGAGLNDGVARLVGWTHEVLAGRLRAWVGVAQQGSDAFRTYQTSFNGYNGIGRSYSADGDGYEGDIGAFIVTDGTPTEEDIELLDGWARQSFDTEAPAAFDPTQTGPTQFFKPGDYVGGGTDTWTATIGNNMVATGFPGPSESPDGEPSFNIITDFLLQASSGAFSVWGGNCSSNPDQGRHLFAKITTSGLNAWGTALGATRYTNPSPIMSSGQYTGLHLYRTGAGPYQFFVAMYDWTSSAWYAEVEVTSLVDGTGNGTFIIEGKKLKTSPGGNSDLFVRAHPNVGALGSWVAGDTGLGNTGTTSDFVRCGAMNGIVHTALVWNRALSDWTSAKMVEWARAL